MKKLILIVLVLLLLAGGGGGYWWFFMRGAEDAAEEAPPPQEPAVFVELEPLTVPVIRGGAVAKYVLLKLALEVEDEGAREAVIERMPRLKDAILRDLHSYFAAVPLDSPLNVRTVKRRLHTVVERIVGAGVVQEVLIQGAFEKTG